jgi:hypothetical protein
MEKPIGVETDQASRAVIFDLIAANALPIARSSRAIEGLRTSCDLP